METTPTTSANPEKRLDRTPRVVVTRRLGPVVEDRMGDLFEVSLNATDLPLTREQLIEDRYEKFRRIGVFLESPPAEAATAPPATNAGEAPDVAPASDTSNS